MGIIKNSLPGVKSSFDNTPNMIDIHRGPIDLLATILLSTHVKNY